MDMIKTTRQVTEDCEEFFRELGRGIPEEEKVMAGYAPEVTVQVDETGRKKNSGWWPTPHKDGKWIDINKNCYVCISSSKKTKNPTNGKERYWRGEASFGHGLAIMIDDIGQGKSAKGDFKVEHFENILPPTVVVETSPGNHQIWYFLDRPEQSLIRFKSFLSSFVSNVLKTGGDNTIKDVSRYGRLPGGINNKRFGPNEGYKYVDEDGKPLKVHLLSKDYSRRYSIDQITKAFKFTISLPSTRPESFFKEEYKFDEAWLRMAEGILDAAKLGEGSGGSVVMNMSGKFRILCPWGHTHSNGDPSGAYFRGPIPGAEISHVFGCGHDGCRKVNKRGWDSFVDAIVMPKIYAELDAANSDPVESDKLKAMLDRVYTNKPGWRI